MPGNPWTPGASAFPVGYATHLRLRVREGRLVGGPEPFVEEPIVPPDAPTDLACVAVSPSQINLTWTDNSNNEDGFKIERAPAPGGPFVQIDTVGPDITAYSDGMRDSLTEYCYRVRAFNAAGDSAYSNESCCTTLPTPAQINKQPWPIPLHVPFFTQLFGGYRLGQWWAADGSKEKLIYNDKVIALSPLAFYPANDLAGPLQDRSGNGFDGTVIGANWLFGVPGIGDGETAIDADNSLEHRVTGPAGLVSAADPNEGTWGGWANFETGGAYDANMNFLFDLSISGPDRLRAFRTGGGSSFTFERLNGGLNSVTFDNGAQTGWHHYGFTWSVTNTRLRFYYDGILQDEDAVGIAAIVGGFVGVNMFASSTSGSRGVNGPVAKAALFDSELNAEEMAVLGTL